MKTTYKCAKPVNTMMSDAFKVTELFSNCKSKVYSKTLFTNFYFSSYIIFEVFLKTDLLRFKPVYMHKTIDMKRQWIYYSRLQIQQTE